MGNLGWEIDHVIGHWKYWEIFGNIGEFRILGILRKFGHGGKPVRRDGRSPFRRDWGDDQAEFEKPSGGIGETIRRDWGDHQAGLEKHQAESEKPANGLRLFGHLRPWEILQLLLSPLTARRGFTRKKHAPQNF